MTGTVPTMPDLAGMTELEEKLCGPQGRHVRDSADARLGLLMASIDTAAAAGLPPAEFAAAQELSKGLYAARSLLANYPVGGEEES